MKLFRLFHVLIQLFLISAEVEAQATKAKVPYKDTRRPIETRVKDLLSRMTVEEKVAQLQCLIREISEDDSAVRSGIGNLAITLRSLGPKEAAEKANQIQKTAVEKSRLGIPIIIHDEALHGLLGKGATSFPQAIGLAATWDTDLMEKVAKVIARQTKSRGVRQILSPVINIARDVRWGRVEETYGEDPYLTARMGVAFCKPIEQAGVITTPKHFAANVGDGGRDSHPIHFSERLLREIYFPAFKACFLEAGATSVMAAYNALNGLPCSANPWLLTDVLRKEWGFSGFVVSDYGSVGGIMSLHGTAATRKETAEEALEAGLEVEFPGVYIYGTPLLEAVKDRSVSRRTLDTAVARVLRAKFRLGLFEHPYVDPATAVELNDTPEDRALALEAARKTIVLLKNEDGLLPLRKDVKTIAVIGPNADATRLGGYSGFGMEVVSVLQGIKNRVSSTTQVLYALGCTLGEVGLPTIPSEVLSPPAARQGEHGLRGEYFSNVIPSGEPALVRIDREINFDWGGGPPDSTLPSDHFSVRWTGNLVPRETGVYKMSVTTDDGVRLYIDNRLMVNSWVDRAPTADYFTMKLEAGHAYDIRIECYENAGGAFAALGWNLKTSVDKDIAAAVEAAKKAEVAVIVAGILEGEGRDRADLNLSGSQESLVKAVAATGVPTVVVLMAGSAVTMDNWIDDVKGILDAWYAGEEGGNAVADVLFGNYNPAGRLPITFPQSVGQVPLYYNTKPSGRGYDYVNISGKPLYPFGYGLSYTEFLYSNLGIDPDTVRSWRPVRVSLDVSNTGSREGDEVVQLYLHDESSNITRPLKELAGFKRVTLKPGEQKKMTFVLTPDQLMVLDKDLKSRMEPRTIGVMVGSSSDDIRVTKKFEIAAGPVRKLRGRDAE